MTCAPRAMISGKPEMAALGINHFMRSEGVQFPPVDGVAAICREVHERGTDDDRECLDATVHRVCTQVGLRLEQRSNLDGL